LSLPPSGSSSRFEESRSDAGAGRRAWRFCPIQASVLSRFTSDTLSLTRARTHLQTGWLINRCSQRSGEFARWISSRGDEFARRGASGPLAATPLPTRPRAHARARTHARAHAHARILGRAHTWRTHTHTWAHARLSARTLQLELGPASALCPTTLLTTLA
jgi:hypothetical protein